MKFNFGKKVLAVTLAALTILTTGISSLPTTVHAEEGTGESASVVTNDTYSQFGKHSGHYVFSTGGAQYTAFCLHPDKESPGKHDTFNSIGYSDNQMLRKVMYYGATGPADIVTSFYSGDAQKTYLATHYLASAANAGAATIDDSPYKGYYGDINNVRNLYSSIAAQANPPEEFKVTLWALKGNPNKQTLSTFKTVAKPTPPDTYLTMTKTSALPAISDGNSCYSLAGAEYMVYTDSGCTSPAKDVNGNTAVLTTDANGNANTIHFQFEGTVYAKETKAPQGYEMDSTVHSVTLSKNTTATFTASDMPGNDPVNLFLSKKDAETGDSNPAGGAKLEGAEYTVRYYDTISSSDPAASGATPKRTWVFRTNKNGYFSLNNSYKTSGDELYTQNGVAVLPLGTVTFTETKAPEGYKLNPTVYVANTSMDPASRAVRTTNLPTEATAAKEQVYRGDFRIRKIEASSGRTLANIPFRITSVETGEYHDIMTDENGVYDSSSTFVKHSQDTNGGKATSGLWFTGESTGTKAPVDDSLGALPYGTYKIEELSCKENEKYVPFNDTFTVSRDGYTVDFNTIPNWDKPEIASDATGDLGNSHFAMSDTGMSINDRVSYDNITENALKYYGVNGTSNLTMVSKIYDKTTGDHVGTLFGKVQNAVRKMLGLPVEEKQTVIDTVNYWNLIPGETYSISGVLMDKNTGEAVKDSNGQTVTGTTGDFVADKADGSKEISYSVDASKYENTTFVVFETLNHKSVDVAKHTDINDEDQSIYNMESHTTYVSGETKDHVGVVTEAGKTTTTTDTVAVKNLKAGETYTITGTLHVKETGEELKDANGKAITATKTFNAGDTSAMTVTSVNGNSISGSIDLTFTYDSSLLSGKTVVAFETVDHNEKTIYVHADLTDKNQSVYYPDLSTKALNTETKDQSGSLGTMKLSDTISMKNLIPGKEYTVKGVVMDKDTGKAVSAEGTKTFTAKKSQETIVLSFTVKNDGSLEGHTLVLVDHLYHNDVLVKNHADLTDKDQSIYIPKIRTTAVDGKSGTHSGIIGSTTLVDTITYENLIPGKEYTVFGSLMNAKTGEKMIDLAGNYMEAKKTFTASERNGKVTLSFAIDSRLLKDVTVVAFEDLYHENVKVAVHADLTDKDQSVHYPGMGTSATVNGSHYAPTAKKTKLVDRVWYQNLVPGHTYRVEGTLMDKATGKPILINGGEVTVKKDFVPKSANGYVDMEFEFNSSSLDKHTVVVYEHMYDGKVLLTSHADINDSAQSVRFDNAPAKGLSPKTGDPTNPFLPAVPFGAASIMLIVLVLLKKKKNVTR